MVIISILLRYQGINEYKLILLHTLDAELSPVMIKKLIYQTADYLRIAHMFPFLDNIKDILTKRDIKLPLENVVTTTLEKVIKAQTTIFGEHIKETKIGNINC